MRPPFQPSHGWNSQSDQGSRPQKTPDVSYVTDNPFSPFRPFFYSHATIGAFRSCSRWRGRRQRLLQFVQELDFTMPWGPDILSASLVLKNGILPFSKGMRPRRRDGSEVTPKRLGSNFSICNQSVNREVIKVALWASIAGTVISVGKAFMKFINGSLLKVDRYRIGPSLVVKMRPIGLKKYLGAYVFR